MREGFRERAAKNVLKELQIDPTQSYGHRKKEILSLKL